MKTNPQIYITPKMGGRQAQTTFYWNDDKEVFVNSGCYNGTLNEFEERVKKVHAETKHLKPYLSEIKKVKYLITVNR